MSDSKTRWTKFNWDGGKYMHAHKFPRISLKDWSIFDIALVMLTASGSALLGLVSSLIFYNCKLLFAQILADGILGDFIAIYSYLGFQLN